MPYYQGPVGLPHLYRLSIDDAMGIQQIYGERLWKTQFFNAILFLSVSLDWYFSSFWSILLVPTTISLLLSSHALQWLWQLGIMDVVHNKLTKTQFFNATHFLSTMTDISSPCWDILLVPTTVSLLLSSCALQWLWRLGSMDVVHNKLLGVSWRKLSISFIFWCTHPFSFS